MVSESFLKKAQIPIIHVERGGDITFHGPGHLVGYIILDLRTAKLTIIDYVESTTLGFIALGNSRGAG